MGVVHHANYVRYLELARIVWLDEHHRPYREVVASGRHYATTRVEVDYRQSARFDDTVTISAWLEWVRGASLRIAYQLTTDSLQLGSAATEHAMVDLEGRVRRIPREWREELATRMPTPS